MHSFLGYQPQISYVHSFLSASHRLAADALLGKGLPSA